MTTGNKRLDDLWDATERTGDSIPIGDIVVCDVCSEDYTERDDTGGFIFGSYAYCPACAKKQLPAIRGYGEEHMIRARCPEAVTFANFVRAQRGPDAAIQIVREE